MIVRHKPYIINKTAYSLIPKKLAELNDFDTTKPFLLRIIKPKKTKGRYFNECKDISGADYVATSIIFKENNIDPNQEIEFEVYNV